MEIEEKIQALLNKAGSTTFEEESSLFYAKAQELMLKYAISEEQLWQNDPSKTQKPILEVTVFRGDNGEDRFQLWHIITKTNRCKCWLDSHGRAVGGYKIHTAGYPSDIAYCQSLYASLLKQMDLACIAAEFKAAYEEGLTQRGIRTFRISFAQGYFERIKHRMYKAWKDKQDAPAEPGTDLIITREAKVNDYIQSDLGISLTSRTAMTRSNIDNRGVVAGKAAGDNAEITLNDKLNSSRTQIGR